MTAGVKERLVYKGIYDSGRRRARISVMSAFLAVILGIMVVSCHREENKMDNESLKKETLNGIT
ncbi:MAG: hypothetical protein ACREN0_05830, partial [Thermodesulfobacteriota bacterium]